MKKTLLLHLAQAAMLVSIHASAAAQAAPGGAPHRPAYYVADFEATVPGAIQPYSDQVESTFRPYGGRFIVRGGELIALEGTPPKGRQIVIRFDDLDKARAWYHSAAYAKLKPIRWAAGKTNVYLIEGLPPDAEASAR